MLAIDGMSPSLANAILLSPVLFVHGIIGAVDDQLIMDCLRRYDCLRARPLIDRSAGLHAPVSGTLEFEHVQKGEPTFIHFHCPCLECHPHFSRKSLRRRSGSPFWRSCLGLVHSKRARTRPTAPSQTHLGQTGQSHSLWRARSPSLNLSRRLSCRPRRRDPSSTTSPAPTVPSTAAPFKMKVYHKPLVWA